MKILSLNCSTLIVLCLSMYVSCNTNFIHFSTDAKKEAIEHLTTLTNIPRASYKLKKDDSSSFWTVQLNIQEETKEVPMLILFYSNSSWFSVSSTSSNIDSYDCDISSSCMIYDSPDPQNVAYLTYNISGVAATLQAFPTSYTIPFNASAVSNTSTVPTPPIKIYGGLGLGLSNTPGYTSFLQSFINLDKNLAGLYLSLNNFDVTSELIVGDYNPNFFDPDDQNITLDVIDEYTWTVQFDTLTDSIIKSAKETKTDYNITGYITFDPNSDFIGVPTLLYDTFLSNLTSKLEQTCTSSRNKPTCDCSSNTSFPTLQYTTGNQTILIPSEAYVQTGVECTLQFVANNESGIIDAFSDNWIFGAPVMTYYYTIMDFGQSPSQITLVKAQTFESNTKWYLILGIITAVVLIAGLIACLSILRSKKTEQFNEPLIMSELADKKQIVEEEKEDEERKEPN